MRSYKETSDEVFNRIRIYEKKKKRIRKIAVSCTVAVLACMLSLPIFIQPFGGNKNDAAPAGPPGNEYAVGDNEMDGQACENSVKQDCIAQPEFGDCDSAEILP